MKNMVQLSRCFLTTAMVVVAQLLLLRSSITLSFTPSTTHTVSPSFKSTSFTPKMTLRVLADDVEKVPILSSQSFDKYNNMYRDDDSNIVSERKNIQKNWAVQNSSISNDGRIKIDRHNHNNMGEEEKVASTENFDALYHRQCIDIINYQNNDTIVDELFTSLLSKVASYNKLHAVNTTTSSSSLDNNSTIPILLEQAYHYARVAHEGQCRKSGEPYIIHPLQVAHIIADMKLDVPSLLCALLHDTVEDNTAITLDDISNTFGYEISQLVDGVTKVGKIPLTATTWRSSSSSYQEQQSENYRKLILSTSKDIRVLLVKLADRAHNMRTLEYNIMPLEKQIRISAETMEIYAPLAHRLGIYWLKTEMEDNCFKYLHPAEYKTLEGQVRGSEVERKRYEKVVVNMLVKQMKDAGLGENNNSTLSISGRTKGLYSIHTKMKKQDIEFDDVHDILAFRIIVDDVASCYQALGIIHSHYKPVPGKIKDYIALPKQNGYRSLHTTVFGPNGRIEIQIRTKEMHEVAEAGVAAHWLYKQGNNGIGDKERKENVKFVWLKELVKEVRRQPDPKEFVKSVKEGEERGGIFYFCFW